MIWWFGCGSKFSQRMPQIACGKIGFDWIDSKWIGMLWSPEWPALPGTKYGFRHGFRRQIWARSSSWQTARLLRSSFSWKGFVAKIWFYLWSRPLGNGAANLRPRDIYYSLLFVVAIAQKIEVQEVQLITILSMFFLFHLFVCAILEQFWLACINFTNKFLEDMNYSSRKSTKTGSEFVGFCWSYRPTF